MLRLAFIAHEIKKRNDIRRDRERGEGGRERERERERERLAVSCAAVAAHEKRERHALSRARDGERRLVGVRATEGASRKSEKTGPARRLRSCSTVQSDARLQARETRVRTLSLHSVETFGSYVSLHGDHVPARVAKRE